MPEIIRVVEDGVEFFTVAETGATGMSQSGLAKISGVAKSTIGRLIVQILAKNAPKQLRRWIGAEVFLSTLITKKGGKLKLIHKAFALDVVKYFYGEGFCTLAGCHQIDMPFFEKKKVICQSEREYKHKLAKALSGKTEVPTLAGSIDVLTTTEIIEVKRVNDWKHAIGQVLVYGKYFPKHQKRIHLFGQTTDSYLELVVTHAKEFDIRITWEI